MRELISDVPSTIVWRHTWVSSREAPPQPQRGQARCGEPSCAQRPTSIRIVRGGSFSTRRPGRGGVSRRPEETANALAETAVERAVEHLRHSQTTRHSAAVDLTTSPQTLVSALSQQLKLSRDQAVDGGTLGDAGFSLLRSLHAADEQAEALILPRPCATAQPISLAGHGSAASAALSASSPTSVAQVLTGDYLAFDPMAYPARCLESVYALTPMLMLVLEAPHEDRPAIGLVVNAPTRLQLRSSHWMHALECPDGGVFQCCPVFYGGPDELRSITMLHPHGEQLPGSRRVTRTLWTGGYLSDAAQLVRTRRAQPSDFLFFRGRHEWRTGEMERQLAERLIGPVRSIWRGHPMPRRPNTRPCTPHLRPSWTTTTTTTTTRRTGRGLHVVGRQP